MKIFGIGLARTGTTSLTKALRILGYRAVHFPTSFDQILYHDAATDTSVACRFAELDRLFPGSKFILTVRDEQSWLASYARFRSLQIPIGKNWPMLREARRVREILFGTQEFEPEAWLAGYRRHTARVMEYFAERPQDLLVMNIAAGDGWEKLCPFLGKPVPPLPFPYLNKKSPLGKLPPWLASAIRIPYFSMSQLYDFLLQRLQSRRWRRRPHGPGLDLRPPSDPFG